jgi:hypothetical protein
MTTSRASTRCSRCRRPDRIGYVVGVFEANGQGLNIRKRVAFMTKESEDKKVQRAREGAQAWADYQAESRATRERTARLRALRLARDAATNNLADTKKQKKK